MNSEWSQVQRPEIYTFTVGHLHAQVTEVGGSFTNRYHWTWEVSFTKPHHPDPMAIETLENLSARGRAKSRYNATKDAERFMDVFSMVTTR